MTAQDQAGLSVLLTVRDILVSLRFYRDQLGFELAASWPNEQAPSWCKLVLEEQSIMLSTPPEPLEGEPCHEVAAEDLARYKNRLENLEKNRRGVGVAFYLAVPDVDAYHDELRERGMKPLAEPKTQFYGNRELTVDDPDGYELVFFTSVSLPSCQSCGMPLLDASSEQKYCTDCTNEKGHLRPYDQVFEGTVTTFFMAVHKLPRPEAEEAARKHLRKMPAWSGF